MPIYPVPTTRTSDQLLQSRLLGQLQGDQLALLRIQTQISTGRRLIVPSDDASAASRAQNLKRLLDTKSQIKTNLSTSQSFLDATDSALGGVSSLLASVRADALGVVGTTNSPQERSAVAESTSRALEQLINTANKQFRGRYLFSGSRIGSQPFRSIAGQVSYNGNEGQIQSFSDIDSLFPSNVDGHQVFGAYSSEVKGAVDLNPILTTETRLVDLRGGLGVSKGTIRISDGNSSRDVDISGAETIGDVARLIEANPPIGRNVQARVTAKGLNVELADDNPNGNLTIREVGAGTTASELGIVNPAGVGHGVIVGADLNPVARATTPLNNLLGVRAIAYVSSPGPSNGVILEARTRGAASNGVRVQFVDDRLLHASDGLVAGSEVATYSDVATAARAAVSFSGFGNNLLLTSNTPGRADNQIQIEIQDAGAIGASATTTYDAVARKLTIGIDGSGATRVSDVISAVNSQGLFTATYDGSNVAEGAFNPNATISPADAGVVFGNTGNSGGDAKTIFVRIEAGKSSAENVVQALRDDPTINALFDARIDTQDIGSPSLIGKGAVDVNATAVTSGGEGAELDLQSGLKIKNGENNYTIDTSGATTLEDLLNLINRSGANVLATLNASRTGIDVRSTLSGADLSIGENGGTTATQLGIRSVNPGTTLSELNYGRGLNLSGEVDFTITRDDGVALDINLAGAQTIQDILDRINQAPANTAGAAKVNARLAAVGNGIELYTENPTGPGSISISRNISSEAARQLGLIAPGAETAQATPAKAAGATLAFPSPYSVNTGLKLTANQAGVGLNGVTVQFQSGASGNNATASYSASTKTLTITIDPTATTSNTVLAAVNSEGTFSAALDTTSDPSNNGTGVIGVITTTATASGGVAESLIGSDPRPIEVKGVFTALIRLRDALKSNDTAGIERAIGLLDTSADQVNFARAEIGGRSQGLDAVRSRLDDETTELSKNLSDEIDTDYAQAISDLNARQAAYEASLQLAGRLFKVSLLDYL